MTRSLACPILASSSQKNAPFIKKIWCSCGCCASRFAQVIVIGVFALFFNATQAFALPVQYQQCVENSTCMVGEFFYTDAGNPDVTAVCTLTSRKPDGTLFLNGVSMTGQSDGWFSYSVNTTSATLGIYRSTMCCTPTGSASQMCLEKTFEIISQPATTAEGVANAVWNATASAHTTAGTFGSLFQNPLTAADVWGYSTRTLSSFGSVASDIWATATRTLTSSNVTTTSSTDNSTHTTTNNYTTTTTTTAESTTNQDVINTLKEEIQSTRSILEKLLERPIISSSFENNTKVAVEDSLQQTTTLATQLAESHDRAMNMIDLLRLTWKQQKKEQILETLKEVRSLLGTTYNNPTSGSMLDTTHTLGSTWNSVAISSLEDQYKAALISIQTAYEELSMDQTSDAGPISLIGVRAAESPSGGSDAALAALDNASKYLSTAQVLLGTANDDRSKATVFGFIKTTQTRLQTLREQETSALHIIENWDTLTDANRITLITTLSKQTLSSNQLPDSSTQFLNDYSPDIKTLSDTKKKDYTLQLLSLIRTNIQLLTEGASATLHDEWMSHELIIHLFVANPAQIARTFPVDYTLPAELTKEDILEIDPQLTLEYNADESTYHAVGNITLDAKKTVDLQIKTKNVWVISEQELSAVKDTAFTLSQGLAKSSYADKAYDLYKGIAEIIDTITGEQKQLKTVEQLIKQYREHRISMLDATNKLAELKRLSVLSTSLIPFEFLQKNSTIFMILVLILVFSVGAFSYGVQWLKHKHLLPQDLEPFELHHSPSIIRRAIIVFILFTIAGSTSAATFSAVLSEQRKQTYVAQTQSQPQVLGAKTMMNDPGMLYGHKKSVPVHMNASASSPVQNTIPENITVVVRDTSGSWSQIQYIWHSFVYQGWVPSTELKP